MKRLGSLICALFLVLALIFSFPAGAFAANGGAGGTPGTNKVTSASSKTSSAPQNSTSENPPQNSTPEKNTTSKKKTSSKPVVHSSGGGTVQRKASSAPASSRRKRRKTASSSPPSSAPASSEAASFVEPSSAESETLSLPAVGSVVEQDPLSSAVEPDTGKKTLIGVLSWACILLGVLVVLIVVLSNRRPPRGPGRKRYRRPRRGGKHLLNDRYYRGLNRY